MSAYDYDRGHEDGWYAAGKIVREYRDENERLQKRVMDLEMEIGHCSKRKCPTQKALDEQV